MIASHVRNELHFAGGKAAQVAVHDQVVGVLVMALVVDQVPDVVQQRRSPENVGAGRWQREGVAQRFEQRGPQARHVLAVALVGVTLAREAAHRLHAIRLLGPGSRWGRDARQIVDHRQQHAVPDATIVHEDALRAEPARQPGDHSHPGHDDVGALRIQARNLAPRGERGLPQSVEQP